MCSRRNPHCCVGQTPTTTLGQNPPRHRSPIFPAPSPLIPPFSSTPVRSFSLPSSAFRRVWVGLSRTSASPRPRLPTRPTPRGVTPYSHNLTVHYAVLSATVTHPPPTHPQTYTHPLALVPPKQRGHNAATPRPQRCRPPAPPATVRRGRAPRPGVRRELQRQHRLPKEPLRERHRPA